MIAPQEIVVILLAAGQSTRFGEDDKLLADLDGHPLILHVANRIVALNAGRMIAICRARAGRIADLISPLGFEIIVNPEPKQGLSSSLARGIEAAAQGSACAALICLGDMPFVSAGHLHALLEKFDADEAPIISSRAGVVTMPPAMFGRAYFDQLRSGRGDQGAKALLSSAPYVIAPAEELADIDTIEDLRCLKR